MQRDIVLSSLSAPCVFIGEYTEKELPTWLAPSFLSPFMSCRDYGGRILVASTIGLIIIIYLFIYLSIFQTVILLKGIGQNEAHIHTPLSMIIIYIYISCQGS